MTWKRVLAGFAPSSGVLPEAAGPIAALISPESGRGAAPGTFSMIAQYMRCTEAPAAFA